MKQRGKRIGKGHAKPRSQDKTEADDPKILNRVFRKEQNRRKTSRAVEHSHKPSRLQEGQHKGSIGHRRGKSKKETYSTSRKSRFKKVQSSGSKRSVHDQHIKEKDRISTANYSRHRSKWQIWINQKCDGIKQALRSGCRTIISHQTTSEDEQSAEGQQHDDEGIKKAKQGKRSQSRTDTAKAVTNRERHDHDRGQKQDDHSQQHKVAKRMWIDYENGSIKRLHTKPEQKMMTMLSDKIALIEGGKIIAKKVAMKSKP